jgi:hypothetical protein
MLGLLMKPLFRLLAATLLVLSTSQLAAEPAPYWQWRSKVDGRFVCSQTPLGPGWDKAAGPYQDSHCQYLRRGK